MADFCKQCSEEIFGRDSRDLANLCGASGMTEALCEGCGWVYVNSEGKRVCEVDPREGDSDYQLRMR